MQYKPDRNDKVSSSNIKFASASTLALAVLYIMFAQVPARNSQQKPVRDPAAIWCQAQDRDSSSTQPKHQQSIYAGSQNVSALNTLTG